MPDSAEPALPVYVLNWNGGGTVLACIEAVLRSERVVPDLLVVDNGSTDGSRERLVDRLGRDRVLPLRENRGYAGGMNVALERLGRVGGEWALLLTQDVIVAPDTLARLLEAARHDVDAGIVGPIVVFRERPERIIGAGGRIRPGRVRAEHIREVPRGTPYRVDWVDGCCLLVRCAAAAAVGGFDEDYFLYYEDADLCQRVGHAGWSILVAPGAEVGHDKSAVPAAHYFHYMTRNRYRFWRKNFGIGAARVGATVAADVLYTLAAWAKAFFTPGGPGERPERLRRFLRQLRGAASGTVAYLRGETGRAAAHAVEVPTADGGRAGA